MRIQIPLQLPFAETYNGMLASLKQLELSVHHAQKAVENAQKAGILLREEGLSYIDIKDESLLDDDKSIGRPIIEIYLEETGTEVEKED